MFFDTSACRRRVVDVFDNGVMINDFMVMSYETKCECVVVVKEQNEDR